MRTLKQSTLDRVEAFIKEYQKENGLSPSYRAIMHEVGMSSLNLVQRYVLELEKKGKIKRTNLGNIATPRKLKPSEMTSAPLVGQIACGQLSFAVEDIEGTYMLPRDIFGNGELFLLRAFGNSMIEIGIEEGDLLVLKKQNYAEEVFRKGKKIVLHPENAEMRDIIVDDCQVQGVLAGSIKTY